MAKPAFDPPTSPRLSSFVSTHARLANGTHWRPVICKIVTSSRGSSNRPGVDPRHDHIDDVILRPGRQLDAPGDAMPLLEAGPATCGGGVLGDENGMTPIRSLFTIFEGVSWSKPFPDDLTCMRRNHFTLAQGYIITVAAGQFEAGTKSRSSQILEELLVHISPIADAYPAKCRRSKS